MKKKISLIAVIASLFFVLTFSLIYTRPRTIEQRYAELDLSECIEINGYYLYRLETIHSFSISPDDEDFDSMTELFRQTSFKTRLRNILPRGTKTHIGDGFEWGVYFKFESVPMKDGSFASGDLLYVNNFYGDIEMSFDGDIVQCSVKDSERWLKDVLDIAQLYAD